MPLKTWVAALRGQPTTDPIVSSDPSATTAERIAAHNALLDLANPGRDYYCGKRSRDSLHGPCILKDGHRPVIFDPHRTWSCMDATGREQAQRFLIHGKLLPW